MWHMILGDIREKYLPGNGKLRAIVITDGLDTHSPSPYQGIQGMNPMMRQLLEDGFDIEWHIVVISINNILGRPAISSADILKYEALAETTGGGFLHIDEPGVMNDYSARHFLTSLEKAVTGSDSSFLDSANFSDQQSKGARFLRRLHQSNHHFIWKTRQQIKFGGRSNWSCGNRIPWHLDCHGYHSWNPVGKARSDDIFHHFPTPRVNPWGSSCKKEDIHCSATAPC